MVLAILDYLKGDILDSEDMPEAINAIKSMKEHRNSFVIDEKVKSRHKFKSRFNKNKNNFKFESK